MVYVQDARAAVEAAQARESDGDGELTYRQLVEHPVTQMLDQVAKSGEAPYRDEIDDLRLPKRARRKLVEAIHGVIDTRQGDGEETTRKRGGERSKRKETVTSRTSPMILAKQAARTAAEEIIPNLPKQYETRQQNERRVSTKDRPGRAVVDEMRERGMV